MQPRTAPLVTVERRPLAQLLHELRALGDLRRRAADVDALLDDVSVPLDAILPRLPFVPRNYARTLVHRDPWFELLLVTWSPGSVAPVHDHDGQDCWLVPLGGSFDLADYAIVDEDGERAQLRPLRSRRLGPGELDRRDEHEGVHAVTPATPLALSLHIYARPLARCRVFDLARGTWAWHPLGYDAVARELGS